MRKRGQLWLEQQCRLKLKLRPLMFRCEQRLRASDGGPLQPGRGRCEGRARSVLQHRAAPLPSVGKRPSLGGVRCHGNL